MAESRGKIPYMSDEKRLPCEWRFKLPRFCEGRKCETCVLNKKGQVKAKESEEMVGDALRRDGKIADV